MKLSLPNFRKFVAGAALLALFSTPSFIVSPSFAAAPVAVVPVAEDNVIRETGTGATPFLAEVDALAKVIRRMNGVDVSGIEGVRSRYTAALKKDGSNQSELDVEYREVVATYAGKIGNYTTGKAVRRLNTNDDTHYYQVAIAVRTYKVVGKDPSKSKLAKIVVRNFKYHNGRYNLSGTNLNMQGVDQRINTRIENALTQSKRFIVLNIKNDAEYLQQRAREESSGEYKTPELNKFGARLGADWLVTGEIEEFNGERVQLERDYLAPTGDVIPGKYTYRGNARVSYRIMDVSTGQNKFAAHENIDMATVPGDNFENRFYNAADILGDRIATRILEDIYPLKVAKVLTRTNSVVINRGGEGIVVGQYYTVRTVGEPIIDPDTNESIGSSEEDVAIVQVTSVQPKNSNARLVWGNLSAIKSGDILRLRDLTRAPIPPSQPAPSPAAPPPAPGRIAPVQKQ
ncbi:MAG: penicillin-binding protein activator LpoB [Puniceicoccales bacterium]|jgi:hypothetical protein|nr:penicillin-binding protein activator LpoB [Puniceicoccales bacterium]